MISGSVLNKVFSVWKTMEIFQIFSFVYNCHASFNIMHMLLLLMHCFKLKGMILEIIFNLYKSRKRLCHLNLVVFYEKDKTSNNILLK